jgi:endonuclease G, mitochondrial
MKKISLFLVSLIFVSSNLFGQIKRDSVLVKTSIFTVMYSEKLEQPLWVRYTARPIKKVADRKGLDFYTEKEYHTSDNGDYVANVWDKGHMAPAAHFTDSKENLKQTFTYLNSTLQHEKLNRGEWRLLEAQERVWADTEVLEVYIRAIFSEKSQKLPSGAVVPDGFWKEIRFTKSGKVMCFYFPNQPPTKKWPEYQQKCK